MVAEAATANGNRSKAAKAREARKRRAAAAPAPAAKKKAGKPTAGAQIEPDELKAIESIRRDLGYDRTSASYLVRLAILRLIADAKSKRVNFATPLDDVRKRAGLTVSTASDN
jgi:hypothetical protein